MTTIPPFRWLQARPILLTPEERAVWRAYEAEHSLPGYPDVEPPAEVRTRVLDITSRLPQLPPADEAGPDISCLCCMDTGFFVGDFSDIEVPCPDCPSGDWTWRHELNDDMRYGK